MAVYVTAGVLPPPVWHAPIAVLRSSRSWGRSYTAQPAASDRAEDAARFLDRRHRSRPVLNDRDRQAV